MEEGRRRGRGRGGANEGRNGEEKKGRVKYTTCTCIHRLAQ